MNLLKRIMRAFTTAAKLAERPFEFTVSQGSLGTLEILLRDLSQVRMLDISKIYRGDSTCPHTLLGFEKNRNVFIVPGTRQEIETAIRNQTPLQNVRRASGNNFDWLLTHKDTHAFMEQSLRISASISLPDEPLRLTQ